MIAELKFVVKCHGMTKEVRHRKSSSADSKQSQDVGASGSLHSRISYTPGREVTNEYGFKYNGKDGKKDDFNLKPII